MHAHCKALEAQLLESEDPAAALSIAVPLIASQVTTHPPTHASSSLSVMPLYRDDSSSDALCSCWGGQ